MGSNGVSIIIPTMNSARSLEDLLKSINSKSLSEIIIVDSMSKDDTVEIANDYKCKILEIDANRSRARNIGAVNAQFDILLFLDSDMIIEDKLLSECIEMSENYDALIFRELSTGSGIIAKERRFQRLGYFHSMYLESPRCLRKTIFSALGGYDEDMEGFEDLDLTSRIVEKGYKIGWASSVIRHNEENVGIADYVSKRDYYFRFRAKFKLKNGRYYSEVFSIRTRIATTINSVKEYGVIRSSLLLPGFLLLLLIDSTLLFRRR